MKVTYNGITIDYASITNWNETVEYDESGMNLVANKIELTVEGSVFPLYYVKSATEVIEIDSSTTNVILDDYRRGAADSTSGFAFRLNTCLRCLSEPRQNFAMYNPITGEKCFEAYAFREEDPNFSQGSEALIKRRNVDVNGGPKPRSVKVLQTCNEFARISFTIEITKIRCLAGEVQQGDEVLGADPLTEDLYVTNRFWTEETIDANFYTTRVITGTLRIASPLKSVHFWRDVFYPQLEEGFRRESVRYSESQDGLKLSYVITDKQVRCAAPYPATTFSGNCSYSIDNSAVMTMGFNLTMVGRPDAPKKTLLHRCCEAFLNKVKQIQDNKDVTGVINSFNISESLGDPPSASLQAKMTLYASASTDLNGVDDITQVSLPGLSILGEPPEWDSVWIGEKEFTYTRTTSETPNPYGYDVYFIYEEPSAKDEANSEQGGSTPTRGFIKCLATAPCKVSRPRYIQDSSYAEDFEKTKATKTIRDQDDTEYGTPNTSGAQREALDYPYSFYKSDISYFTDYSRIVLPKAPYVAKTPSSGNDESGTNNGEGTESGNTGSGEVDYTGYTIGQLQAEIKKKEAELVTWQSQRDSDASAEMVEQVAQDDVQIESIKKTLSELKKELDSRTSVRVVQVAKPVPKARVVIEAERFGRLPEMPDPDEIISTTGDDPITFTCLKAETQLCDPQAARNTPDSVSYYVIGTYEYAMSRAYRKGDEIWLLQNPTFGSNCYYPKTIVNGVKIDDVDALKTLYNGTQFNHNLVSGTTPALPSPDSGSGETGDGGGAEGGGDNSGNNNSGENSGNAPG